MEITNARHARTLSTSHMRQCIMSESRFDFLRELVKDVPNISWADECLTPQPQDGTPQLHPDTPRDLPTTPSTPGTTPTPTNGAPIIRPNDRPLPVDRPRRNYQRPLSYDAATGALAVPSASYQEAMNALDESPTAILKRKLLEPWKSNSLDSSTPGKLARCDSMPEDLSMNSRGRTPTTTTTLATRRRRSNGKAAAGGGVEPLPLSLVASPIVNISTEDGTSAPIIKIDYNQPSSFAGATIQMPRSAGQITPVINIDFSNLASPVVAAVSKNGSNNINNNALDKKLVLNTTTTTTPVEVSIPHLTTPTHLNKVQSPFTMPAAAGSSFPAPSSVAIGGGGSLEMDEDYDDI